MALVVDSEMASNVGFGVAGLSPNPPATPQTFSFTNAAGTVLYLFVILSVNTGGTTSFGTVSYNSVSMANIVNQTTASGASRIGVFRLLSPDTGANTISIAHTTVPGGANQSAIEAGCISFTGNDMTTPEIQSSGSNGSSTTAAASLSGVTAGNITICGAGAGSSMSAQTQTLSWSNNVQATSQAGNGRASRSVSSGSVTHSFTISSSDSWATAIVEVAAAGATPVSSIWVPRRMPLGV